LPFHYFDKSVISGKTSVGGNGSRGRADAQIAERIAHQAEKFARADLEKHRQASPPATLTRKPFLSCASSPPTTMRMPRFMNRSGATGFTLPRGLLAKRLLKHQHCSLPVE
jgi:hypothetical protein